VTLHQRALPLRSLIARCPAREVDDVLHRWNLVVITVRGVHAEPEVVRRGEWQKGEAKEPSASPKAPGKPDEREAVAGMNNGARSKDERKSEPTHAPNLRSVTYPVEAVDYMNYE